MMLDIVEVFLKHHQYSYVRLDGRTNIPDRYVTFLLKMGEKKMDVCVEMGRNFTFVFYRTGFYGHWELSIERF